MKHERCGNCKYWIPDEDDESGECRKNPPRIIPECAKRYLDEFIYEEGDEDPSCMLFVLQKGFFPLTPEHDWCGEWKQDE